MPASDGLQPPLNEGERAIRRSYGGWTNFMQSYGLKPWDDDDAAEGKAIISALAEHAEQEKTAEATNATTDETTKTK
ncbi:hypothetical protein QQS21_008005 [Conoideocrella luteorostrata]|uniref:Extracellular metalloproteinase 3 n=1 Tax=Conoideocrella luteorostrata TaxID=1105319 RepID=A0AAJ0FWE9_9HYPO|nr:hypothetical protein QQS21_008005 [Conoideocrella luteorostrata]